MIRMILVCVFSVYPVFAALQLDREISSQAVLVGGAPVPAFYKGYLYWLEPAHGHESYLRLYAPDGRLTLSLETQGNRVASALGIAVDTDGTSAIGWGNPPVSESVAGVDLRDQTGKLIRSFETGRYRPAHLCFDRGHFLWTFGYQSRRGQDYMTVRRYRPDGKEVGAYLPRFAFPKGLEPGGSGWQTMGIAVADDRIGLWAYSGMYGTQAEWVEMDSEGKLLGRWRLDEFQQPAVALTSDGHVYLQATDSKVKTHRLYKLNRTSSTWQVIDPAPTEWLAGADGYELVFIDWCCGPMHLRWYKQPR
jgi:hypothetical protein